MPTEIFICFLHEVPANTNVYFLLLLLLLPSSILSPFLLPLPHSVENLFYSFGARVSSERPVSGLRAACERAKQYRRRGK